MQDAVSVHLPGNLWWMKPVDECTMVAIEKKRGMGFHSSPFARSDGEEVA